MTHLTRFLSEGGKVNLTPHQEIEVRVLSSTEIAPFSKNLCYIAHVAQEGEEKVVFVKSQQNPEKQFYIDRFVLNLDLFKTNSLIGYGDDFCIYPLLQEYTRCKNRKKLAKFLATFQNKYDSQVSPEIKARFETHPGYINKYRRPTFQDFVKCETSLKEQGAEPKKIFPLLEFWLAQDIEKVFCHSDYKPCNTFEIEGSEEVGVLDLEEVCADTQTFDLARVLVSMERDQWSEVIGEYSKERGRDIVKVEQDVMLDYMLYVTNILIYTARNSDSKLKLNQPIFLNNLDYICKHLQERNDLVA